MKKSFIFYYYILHEPEYTFFFHIKLKPHGETLFLKFLNYKILRTLFIDRTEIKIEKTTREKRISANYFTLPRNISED